MFGLFGISPLAIHSRSWLSSDCCRSRATALAWEVAVFLSTACSSAPNWSLVATLANCFFNSVENHNFISSFPDIFLRLFAWLVMNTSSSESLSASSISSRLDRMGEAPLFFNICCSTSLHDTDIFQLFHPSQRKIRRKVPFKESAADE